MPAREGEADDVGGLCAADPLAQHLATLKPVPATVDRDRLMFVAGAAAHDRAGRWWKRAFFAQSGVVSAAVLVAVIGLTEPATRGLPAPPADTKYQAPSPVANREPTAPRPADSFAAKPSDTGKLLQLRADVFAAGISVLPTPATPAPVPDVTAVEKSLQLDPGVLAMPHRPKLPADPDSP